MKKICLILLICISALSLGKPADARLFIAEPVLVTQPAYAGMSFYVYKPYDMPGNWYATFDGYPVVRNKDGVWVYGTFSGPNLTPTHYVVGSIIPSMAGLSPYANPVQISSTVSLPQSQLAVQPQIMFMGSLPLQSTYMPDWLFNSRFMALGKWKDSVDRIGILHRVNIPVAWRGNSPNVIYAWNGNSWYHMLAREGERPVGVLKNNLYTLTRQARQNDFTWYEADMPVLAQQAGLWGYYWMGEVMPR